MLFLYFYSWGCRFAVRSFGDEFGGAIGADLGLLNIAIILNLVYANVQLTQWNRVRTLALSLALVAACFLKASHSFEETKSTTDCGVRTCFAFRSLFLRSTYHQEATVTHILRRHFESM